MNVLSESFNLELHLGCSAGSNITGISWNYQWHAYNLSSKF
jgi:hypothetical protein